MDNVLLLFFAAIAIAGIGLLALVARGSQRKSRLNRAEFVKRWRQVLALQNQGGSGWQLAIIEADKLLDQALQAQGYPGDTMGERLKDARHVLRNNDGTWQAHKLRNRIAHEQDVRLNRLVVAKALGQFKAALKDLGAL